MVYAEYDYQGFKFFVCDTEHLQTLKDSDPDKDKMPIACIPNIYSKPRDALYVGGFGRDKQKLPPKATEERTALYADLLKFIQDLFPDNPVIAGYIKREEKFFQQAFLASFYRLPMDPYLNRMVLEEYVHRQATRCGEVEAIFSIDKCIELIFSEGEHSPGENGYSDVGYITIGHSEATKRYRFYLSLVWRRKAGGKLKPSHFYSKENLEKKIKEVISSTVLGSHLTVSELTWI